MKLLIITLLAFMLPERALTSKLSQKGSSEQGSAENYLENRVPCLDKSIRYRKRPSAQVLVKTKVAFIAIHHLSSSGMSLTGK